MSPVLVAASAYGASRVRQLGQSHFIDVVADAVERLVGEG